MVGAMADKSDMDEALREIFRLAYYYRRKFQHPTRAEQFWRNAASEMAQLVEQCGNHPFARAVFLACYIDIEHECLERVPEPEQMRIPY